MVSPSAVRTGEKRDPRRSSSLCCAWHAIYADDRAISPCTLVCHARGWAKRCWIVALLVASRAFGPPTWITRVQCMCGNYFIRFLPRAQLLPRSGDSPPPRWTMDPRTKSYTRCDPPRCRALVLSSQRVRPDLSRSPPKPSRRRHLRKTCALCRKVHEGHCDGSVSF